MKATLIISEEYRMNSHSVFILAENGKYYGDLNYPALRKYPKDAGYWVTATSSDSDRGFRLINIFIEDFDKIEKLQNAILANRELLKEYPSWQPPPKYKIRRGRAYEEYCVFKEKEEKELSIVLSYNDPYEKAIHAAKKELRSILLSAKK